MPILVTCSGCKTQFRVSDKFAGKQGPCPKCKAVIVIPALEQAKAAEVVIHEPEAVAAKTGTAIPKPIARKPVRVSLAAVIGLVAAFAAAAAAAWWGAEMWQRSPALRLVGLLAVAFPCARLGYAILRNDELEPYLGRELWIRIAIASVVYALLWAVFYWLPEDFRDTAFGLVVTWIPFFAVGGLAGLACFDLEYFNGVLHYSLYVLVTLALGWLAGLTMPWANLQF
jgi:hypothetical protein